MNWLLPRAYKFEGGEADVIPIPGLDLAGALGIEVGGDFVD